MCPLRLILIFLSATLAGFFVLKNLKSNPQADDDDEQEVDETLTLASSPKQQLPFSQKVGSAICTGFWTCVDMASGRYLWRNLIGPDNKSS